MVPIITDICRLMSLSHLPDLAGAEYIAHVLYTFYTLYIQYNEQVLILIHSIY